MQVKNVVVAAFALMASAQASHYSTVNVNPVCVKVNQAHIQGQGEFVDVDNSGSFPPITTGDQSIADLLTAINFFPFQAFDIKAICTATSSAFGAPQCHFEAALKLCPKQFSATPVKEPALVQDGGLRRTREVDFETKALLDFNQDIVQIDQAFHIKKCREGKIFFDGTGPENFAITGGTEDFFGAFGEVVTGGSFQAVPDPLNPPDILLTFDAQFIICYWPL